MTKEIPLPYLIDITRRVKPKLSLKDSKYSNCIRILARTPMIDLKMVIDSIDSPYHAYREHVIDAVKIYIDNKIAKYNIPALETIYNNTPPITMTRSETEKVWYAYSQHSTIVECFDASLIRKVGAVTYITKSSNNNYYIYDYSNRVGKVYTEKAYLYTCTYIHAWLNTYRGTKGVKLDLGTNEYIRALVSKDDPYFEALLNLRKINEMARYIREIEDPIETECCVCGSTSDTRKLDCGHYIKDSCYRKALQEGYCLLGKCIHCSLA